MEALGQEKLQDTQYNNTHQNDASSFLDHKLLIFDDLMCDIISRKDELMQKQFTVNCTHKNISVIMLSKMLFKPVDYSFNVRSENLHYLFVFKSTINSSKITHLAKKSSSL